MDYEPWDLACCAHINGGGVCRRAAKCSDSGTAVAAGPFEADGGRSKAKVREAGGDTNDPEAVSSFVASRSFAAGARGLERGAGSSGGADEGRRAPVTTKVIEMEIARVMTAQEKIEKLDIPKTG